MAGREVKANKMGGPPSPKRQKVSTNVENSSEEKELAELQKSIDAAGRIEEELELENEKCAEEVLAIENKYNIRRRPFYEKRSKLLNQIPFFWKQTVRSLVSLALMPTLIYCTLNSFVTIQFCASSSRKPMKKS